MTLILGQSTVPANSTVPVFTLPSGLATFTVFQPANPQQVFIGTSSGVTATSGMPVTATPVSTDLYVASKGVTYYGTTGNGTASSFCYLISTAT